MTIGSLPQARPARRSAATSEALVQTGMALMAVIVAVSSFAISTMFGVAATFVLVLVLAIAVPAGVPLLIATAFLFQNSVVAWYSPYIADNDAFDALRGANFVVLMTAFAVFFAAALQPRIRAIPQLRPWVLGGMALGGVVGAYLLLGMALGEPKDAIVYFRNILTPVACFYIAIVAASAYRVDLGRTLVWLAAAAIVYGYCELVFTMDFLSLFHGDDYVQRSIWKQIQTGVWEKALAETGFVYRGLEDVMMTNAFNLPMTDGILPKVFRIGGPNFHAIAYAYGLAVVSVWMLFNRRWLLPLAALPLLMVIGSKGAVVMLLLALLARIGLPLFGARLTLGGVIAGAVLWVGGSIAVGAAGGDYHVLGLFAGLREFVSNPIGKGIGFGGNLSSTSLNINWDLAQAEGAAATPMESALAVLLYQMGVAAAAIYVFVGAIAWAAWRAYRRSGDSGLLFPVIAIIVISANSVLQEEAFFSPLALGLCLLLTGVSLGSHWRALWRGDSSPRQRPSRV